MQMHTKKIPAGREVVACGIGLFMFAGAALLSDVGTSPAFGATEKATGATNQTTSIKGTCNFGGTESTWSATLTAKAGGTYDAVYVSTWGGKPLNYQGTIETDGKTKIKGSGKASGGSANGKFEFSGIYDKDGVARCSYKELGGGRKGTMTAELPKAPDADKAAVPAAGAAAGANQR